MTQPINVPIYKSNEVKHSKAGRTMSEDKMVFRSIKRRIDSTRRNLAELGEITAKKDLLYIIEGMGDFLEQNGFSRDPFKDISGTRVSILHDYLDNGEPSGPNYAAQAIFHSRLALELLEAEPSAKAMQDLAFNAMRAQNFSTLANMPATNMETDLLSGAKSRTSKGNPYDFEKYNVRRELVKQAKGLGKDPIRFVADKEDITIQSAKIYLRNKNLLDN